MNGLRVAAPLLVVLVGCGGSADDSSEEVVLRVSANSGLSAFTPSSSVSGSTAAALDLVFDDLAPHLKVVQVAGAAATLERLPGSRYSTPQLAAALRYPTLVSSRAVDANRIEVRFSEPPEIDLVRLDLGPYRLESQEKGRVRLRRRGDAGPDVIDIVEETRANEWRLLVGRQIDVTPGASALFREQFAGMKSVRVLPIPPRDSSVLYFNLRDPALTSVGARARIAAALDREAIARIACGAADCAERGPLPAADQAVEAPRELHLSVVKDDDSSLLAARVIDHELRALGCRLVVEPTAIEELIPRLLAGQYQLYLGPLPHGARGYARLVSGTESMTGFADPSFDAAVEHGDLDAAERIVERELPVVPLFQIRSFAAVDARFCGNVTPSETSWRWMAELEPCDG